MAHEKSDPVKPYLVGVDLGGTNVRAAVVKRGKSDAAARSANVPSRGQDGAEYTAQQVAEAVRQALANGNIEVADVQGIGMAVPGHVHPAAGMVLWAPNFKDRWLGVPFADMVSKLVGLPVYLGNDANLAALGEFTFGVGRDVKNPGTPGAGQPPRVYSIRGRQRKAILGTHVRIASADGRMVAAVAAGVAIAVVVVIAFASSTSSSRAHSQALGRSQGGFAAVLSSGVSNAMRVAQIELSKLRGDMAVVHRAPASSGRRTTHVVRTPKPARKAASPSHSATVSSNSSAAAPSSPTRTEAPSSGTYPATTQTYDASHESVGTHSDAPTRSQSSSTNPSNATLRSLITGAGTCSCK